MNNYNNAVRADLGIQADANTSYYRVVRITFFWDESIEQVSVFGPDGVHNYEESTLICFMLNEGLDFIPMHDSRHYKGIQLVTNESEVGLRLIETENTSGL